MTRPQKPWKLKIQPLPGDGGHLVLVVKSNGETWGVPVHYRRRADAEHAAKSILGAEVVVVGPKKS